MLAVEKYRKRRSYLLPVGAGFLEQVLLYIGRQKSPNPHHRFP